MAKRRCRKQRDWFPTDKKGFYLLLLHLLTIVTCVPTSFASPDSSERIGKIRAALVFYIVKFVEFREIPLDKVSICTIRDDAMQSYLAETVADKRLHGRGLDVRRISASPSDADLENCNVAFFGFEAVGENASAIERANVLGLLTICLVEKVKWGRCTIEIFEENNKNRIAVDLRDQAKSNVTISAELLEVSLVNRDKS